MIKLHKNESIEHALRRFDRQDRHLGTQNDYRKHQVYVGPSKRRQLKSKLARQRARAMKRRQRRNHRPSYY
ncbi:30S ribosomal protein S21 [Acetilactobacillus jinshanensis]|uniref:Small ribosomal subunit protein bS21 n=1 Tax=Acetilactobacillus jinshanensis TaxID=1720083 RepID=A0A4P6ZLW8_9LACO|nr:30S ribosomal protein S21 [Acetilactobacillus jinshanensis]QBP18230.1 30S ribosomal protein S21 [Acetilactobacillus jinshanensis]URL61100.1 30S ribosomal protein S21 [uncultured bacterium]